MTKYELCHPKSNQKESVMLCLKSNHRTLVNKITKQDLLKIFFEESQKNKSILNTEQRWAELQIIGSIQDYETIWLKRALEKNTSILRKKLILIMKEVKCLHKDMNDIQHKYPNDLNLSWYKAAIYDTENDCIIFRTFKNFCDTIIPDSQPAQIESHSIGWYIYSSNCNRPSKMKADITFWRVLKKMITS